MKPFTTLFGNSYKSWKDQVEECLRIFVKKKEIRGIEKVEVSKALWKAWGGLKWCDSEDFQQELNREGCQEDEPDNPKPRDYSKMKFYAAPQTTKLVNDMYESRLRHLN